MISFIILLLSFVFVCPAMVQSQVKFSNRSSTIRAQNTRMIMSSTPSSDWDGTLDQATNCVSGSPIDFNYGVVEIDQTPSLLKGRYDGDATNDYDYILQGSELLRIDPGRFKKRIVVSGTSNRIEGSPIFQAT